MASGSGIIGSSARAGWCARASDNAKNATKIDKRRRFIGPAAVLWDMISAIGTGIRLDFDAAVVMPDHVHLILRVLVSYNSPSEHGH
jgi:hypothetical protein